MRQVLINKPGVPPKLTKASKLAGARKDAKVANSAKKISTDINAETANIIV